MNKKNKKKGDSTVGGIIIAAVIIFSVLSEAAPGAAGVIIVLAVIAVFACLFFSAAKKTRESKPYGTEKPFKVSPDAVKQTAREIFTELKDEFDVPESEDSEKPETKSYSKRMTEAKKNAETENCEADHVHVEYKSSMTEDEKRLYQLKEMLKNGIISREEYNIMLRRYGLR